MQMHQTRAYIPHIRHPCGRIHHMEVKDWQDNLSEHFKFCLKEVQVERAFEPRRMVLWDKIATRLKREPQRRLNNADTRLVFRLENMFLVKHGFTLGNCQVDPGHQHVLQTSHAAMLCYELPASTRVSPDITRRRRLPDTHQALYERYVLPPHGLFCIPQGTRYVLMAVQKTIFALDVLDGDKGVPGAESFRSHTKYVKVRQGDTAPPSPPEMRPASPRPAAAAPPVDRSLAKLKRPPLGSGFEKPRVPRRPVSPSDSFKIPKRRRIQQAPEPLPRVPDVLVEAAPLESDVLVEAAPLESDVQLEVAPLESDVQLEAAPLEPYVQLEGTPLEPYVQLEATQPDVLPHAAVPSATTFQPLVEGSVMPDPAECLQSFLDAFPEWLDLPPETPRPSQVDFNMAEENPWVCPPSNPPQCDMLQSYRLQGIQLPIMTAPRWMPQATDGVLYADSPQEEVWDLSMPDMGV